MSAVPFKIVVFFDPHNPQAYVIFPPPYIKLYWYRKKRKDPRPLVDFDQNPRLTPSSPIFYFFNPLPPFISKLTSRPPPWSQKDSPLSISISFYKGVLIIYPLGPLGRVRESKGVKKIDKILVGEKKIDKHTCMGGEKNFKAFSRKISRFRPISWGGGVRKILTNLYEGENIFSKS